MHLSRLISRWNAELHIPGSDKASAAAHVVPELSDQEVFSLLSIISRLDGQTSSSVCITGRLGDNARFAIIDWLVRTDTDELIRLGDADLATYQTLVNSDGHQAPLGNAVIKRYLSESELIVYGQIDSCSDWASAWLNRSLHEIVRIRRELARQLGADIDQCVPPTEATRLRPGVSFML